MSQLKEYRKILEELETRERAAMYYIRELSSIAEHLSSGEFPELLPLVEFELSADHDRVHRCPFCIYCELGRRHKSNFNIAIDLVEMDARLSAALKQMDRAVAKTMGEVKNGVPGRV